MCLCECGVCACGMWRGVCGALVCGVCECVVCECGVLCVWCVCVWVSGVFVYHVILTRHNNACIALHHRITAFDIIAPWQELWQQFSCQIVCMRRMEPPQFLREEDTDHSTHPEILSFIKYWNLRYVENYKIRWGVTGGQIDRNADNRSRN